MVVVNIFVVLNVGEALTAAVAVVVDDGVVTTDASAVVLDDGGVTTDASAVVLDDGGVTTSAAVAVVDDGVVTTDVVAIVDGDVVTTDAIAAVVDGGVAAAVNDSVLLHTAIAVVDDVKRSKFAVVDFIQYAVADSVANPAPSHGVSRVFLEVGNHKWSMFYCPCHTLQLHLGQYCNFHRAAAACYCEIQGLHTNAYEVFVASGSMYLVWDHSKHRC